MKLNIKRITRLFTIAAVLPALLMTAPVSAAPAADNSIVKTYSGVEYKPKKRDFRATWVSTVANIDWPSLAATTPEKQRQEFINIVEQSKYMNLNALIVQVRPTADAFYASETTPWSKYLTGEQGKAPNPFYDPLEFMIQTTHDSCMEFHAWFNPFRVSMDTDLKKLAANNVAKTHPEWVVSYGGKLYLNPGIPEARKYLIDSIMEVVRNYDIDAVHFDDYFYPAAVGGKDFDDAKEFKLYGKDFANIADWRRNNVNVFIKEMSESIKAAKSYVKFGISPAGVWRNKAKDPTGSETRAGNTNYDDLFADTRAWIKNGWIDYILPQIYWEFGLSAASYENVLAFWVKEMELNPNVALYIGHATYKLGTTPPWDSAAQITAQLKYNQQFPVIKGDAFFSVTQLLQNKLNIKEVLHNDIYKYIALVPIMPWLGGTSPQPVEIAAGTKTDTSLTFTITDKPGNISSYYAVYRFRQDGNIDMNDPANILTLIRKKSDTTTYTDSTAVAGQKYYYIVTALDRLHYESDRSNIITN